MNTLRLSLAALALLATLTVRAADKVIPDALKPWETWATWGDDDRDCPAIFSDGKKRVCFWPSRLALKVERAGGSFEFGVTVFRETWVPLPGGPDAWPLDVRAGKEALAVIEHAGQPAVRLRAGTHALTGAYRWSEIPQRLPVPREIGLLALSLDGKAVDAPAWDTQGLLWLKRDGSTEEADKNFLAVKLYAALEDGIPLWLRTEIELTVSGKSREEDLGTILPEGWKLSAVESPIPVAIDDSGRMKAQVRAGKWTLRADAFRFDNPKEILFAKTARPAVAEMFFAFRAQPGRVVEIMGAPSVDVSQTTFPEKWRELPVYRWDTTAPFQIVERQRGMGDKKPAGLTIAREWWLDEDGGAFTFRDIINGQAQQLWRLDAAPGQDLGSVRNDGQGQLITRNPRSAAPGVEIRTRGVNLEATGRMNRTRNLAATGWQTDADSLHVTLNLPPGWRLFALFGADHVEGDWLTSWTLLDLFLLLIFTLAVFRLWGFAAGLLAFVAFGLSYHEPGAPRYLWLILLVPLALQRVVPEGWGRRLVTWGKWLATVAFVLVLVPFVAKQVQQALYPQLERIGGGRHANTRQSSLFESNDEYSGRGWGASSEAPSKKPQMKENLNYDTKARIQTGPGIPEWKWRTVSFRWNGPVTAKQPVRPILIPLGVERLLTAARVILLLALAAVLLNARRAGGVVLRTGGKVAAVLLLAFTTLGSAQAQTTIPDAATLDKLRERLLEASDAYPTAADIPTVSLTLAGRKITIVAEIHTATRTAVPLPGRLPAWSPLSVLVNEKPEAALRRDDGYLWVVLPAGVHRVRVEALLADVTEWEWTFLLKPRQVKIDAPAWTFTGVRPGGIPEQQIFFTLKQKAAAASATYDRQDLQTLAAIDRHLELGLIWQVRTTVTRLSPVGKAVALRVPLLPGENVLSSNAVVKDGFIEVRLGAQEQEFAWESGLATAPELRLATRADDAWVERWHLVVSPIWNLAISGLEPIFEADAPMPVTSNSTIRAGGGDLIPTWQPWPGESATLQLSRPEAIAGATITVSRGTHTITLGKRQRMEQLDLALRCSLGEDFLVELPAGADITALAHNGKPIAVRKDGAKLVIPVRPGEQTISIGWKINTPLSRHAVGGEVRLPVESANLQTIIQVPEDRWVLWAHGPQRGPAVRFWGILLCSLLAAGALGRAGRTPVRTVSWMLLVIGLTQVPLPAALIVIGWLFALAARGREGFQRLGPIRYNLLQLALMALTVGAIGVLLAAVREGLLGDPQMFISGNGSSRTELHWSLRWFQARSGPLLPQPGCVSISIWGYRLAMLAWALWLAAALLRWLRWGWQNFGTGGFFHKMGKAKPQPAPEPPPMPGKP
ncbi:MAG: hypothetical protein K8R23_01930 [Chthoniobacter sp.]|nr:hypothetical protein [Chthoniobacter sp.]